MSGLCKMCDGTNTVIVDYDRQVYAPCAACHPSDVYARIAALEDLVRETVLLTHNWEPSDEHDTFISYAACPHPRCVRVRAALARPGGGTEG